MGTNIGLYIRVSTDRQARIDEGSLKSQHQRLGDWVELSNKAYGRDYTIFRVYEDVESGTTTRRLEYQRMLNDVRSGKLRAIVSISISRLNRSLRDFYELQDICEKHDVAIISLKENFDTSTAIGRALLKFMLVFYELESEQTGERVSDNILSRANRGLWTAGRILGYKPVEGKRGYLQVDPINAKTIEFIYDTYIETGSIGMVLSRLKTKGLKTASYITEKGKERKPQDFADETIRRILTNLAYIGKFEISKGRKDVDQTRLPEARRYKVIDGLWSPIIDEEKFIQVQDIMRRNLLAKGNTVGSKKKNFLLAGLVVCGKCTAKNGDVHVKMRASSGTSKTGKSHHYYLCEKCKTRIPAEAIEKQVRIKIGELSQDHKRLKMLTDETNRIVTEELPRLRSQLADLNLLKKAKSDEFDQVYNMVRGLDATAAKEHLQSKGETIAREISEIDKHMQMKEEEIAKENAEKVDFQLVRETLANFDHVFNLLSPAEQQQLAQHLIDHVISLDTEIRIAIDGGVYVEPIKKGTKREFSKSPVKRGRRGSNPRPSA